MPRSRANRFLDAFNGIEHVLRERIAADRGLRFYDLVDRVASSNSAVAAFALDLKQYADLRNAIVHGRGDGRPIADPYPDTVNSIEHIRALLESPPRLTECIVVSRVETCTADTPVLAAAKVMKYGDFSQMPVLDGATPYALLTAETVTRFLAELAPDRIGEIASATVSEVLPFAEFGDNWATAGTDATVFDAIDLFRRASTAGRSLDAILVTDASTLLTIVTPFDMPLLLLAAGR